MDSLEINDTGIDLSSVLKTSSKAKKGATKEEKTNQKLIEKEKQRMEQQPIEARPAHVPKPVKQPKQPPALPVERARLMKLLANYRNSKRFGERLEELGFDLRHETLSKKSVPDLDNLVEEVRQSVSNQNVSKIVEKIGIDGVRWAEALLHDLYTVDGLADALQNDSYYLDLLEELSLETQDMFYVDVKTRLLMKVGQTALIVHQNHKIGQILASTPEGQKVLKKYVEAAKPAAEEPRQKKQLDKNYETKYNDLL